MFKIIKFKKVSSTNVLAKQFFKKEKKNFCLVASEQIEGKGQRNKSWFSPKGGLYFSLGLRPNIQPQNLRDLPFKIALSLQKLIGEIYGVVPEIKKPNDLLINGKKICGILIESKIKGKKIKELIIGIGINLTTNFKKTYLQGVAGSLKDFSNVKVKTDYFLKAFLKKFKEDFKHLLS